MCGCAAVGGTPHVHVAPRIAVGSLDLWKLGAWLAFASASTPLASASVPSTRPGSVMEGRMTDRHRCRSCRGSMVMHHRLALRAFPSSSSSCRRAALPATAAVATVHRTTAPALSISPRHPLAVACLPALLFVQTRRARVAAPERHTLLARVLAVPWECCSFASIECRTPRILQDPCAVHC